MYSDCFDFYLIHDRPAAPNIVGYCAIFVIHTLL